MTVYRWITEPPVTDPALVADLSVGFAELSEAEAWLSTFHDDLRAAGALRVTLLDDQRPILGPMDLAPAD